MVLCYNAIKRSKLKIKLWRYNMKAAVYYGKHNLVVEDVPVRELKDNEVLIQVKYCGVCGTDVHIFRLRRIF